MQWIQGRQFSTDPVLLLFRRLFQLFPVRFYANILSKNVKNIVLDKNTNIFLNDIFIDISIFLRYSETRMNL